MNKTMSFVKLDLQTVKPYMKTICFILVFAIFLGVMIKSASFTVIYMIGILASMFNYPFALSEKCNINILYGTLPLNRKNIVVGRYMFGVLLVIIGAFISLVSILILNSITQNTLISMVEVLLICGMIAFSLVLLSFQYPLYFKFGYTKMKFITLIPSILIVVAVLLLSFVSDMIKINSSAQPLNYILNNAVLISAICIGASIVILLFSMQLSFRIYKKIDL